MWVVVDMYKFRPMCKCDHHVDNNTCIQFEIRQNIAII